MKYNILWFDDKEDYIETHEPTLREHLTELGFDLKVVSKVDDENLEQTLHDNHTDLILMDYHLANGNLGDAVLQRIKDCNLCVEAILYSRDVLFPTNITEQLEGVFFASHDQLPEKAKKIISLTIRKQQDVNNIRGLIIAETIDLETKMEEVISHYFGIDPERKIVCEELVSPEFNVFEFMGKYKLANIICKNRLKTLESKLPTIQGEERQAVIKQKQALENVMTELKKTNEEIIKIRNIMAHTIESEEESNTLISYINKDAPIVINDEFCRKTRKNLKKHKENMAAFMKNMA